MIVFLWSLCMLTANAATPCDVVMTAMGTVCRCNSTYCDTVDPLVVPTLKNEYLLFTSSRDGARLQKTSGTFSTRQPTGSLITLNPSQKFQKITGFGGAFTDAATLNIFNLSKNATDKLFSSYFSTNGIEYNVGRIPMASCDFSTHVYSYDDYANDFNLVNFSLAMEDLKYKIPAIITAQQLAPRPIRLFATPWSAPGWMKTNGKMYGQGSLIGDAGNQYHKTWASYYSKFIDAYQSNGVKIWAVTAQNEPQDGCIPDFSFQAMCFNSTTQRDFIKSDLGPQLNMTHPDVLLLILDGQRAQLPKWAQVVLNDSVVSQFVDGIGIHWYEDEFTPVERLVETHDQFPNYFILGTEACAGFLNHTISPGWWERAEVYALDIINDLNHWVTGWTDWNLALNMQGGPNWANNFVEAPILVDAEKDEFYKGPMFYVLGHFSKFVIPDSIRIGVDEDASSIPRELKVSAFITPMNYTVVQVYNLGNFTHRFAIDPNDGRGEYIETSIPSHALQSFIFQTQ